MLEYLAFDFETNDPYITRKLGGGYPFAINYPDYSDFFPIGCAVQVLSIDDKGNLKKITEPEYIELTTDSMEEAKASEGLKKLKSLFNKYKNVIAHNAMYDLGCLLSLDISIDDLVVYDTLMAARLYHNLLWDYSLEALTERYLPGKAKKNNVLVDAIRANTLMTTKKGTPVKPTTATYNKKAKTWSKNNMALIQKKCPEAMREYAIGDIDCSAYLLAYYRKKANAKQWDLIKFYGRIVKICTKMRIKGINIDMEALEKVKALVDQDINEHIEYLSEKLALSPDRLRSNQAAANAFLALGYTLKYNKETGNYEVNKKAMSSMRDQELVNKYLEFKSLCVLKQSFIDKIFDMQIYTCPIKAKYGRIFPELNPLKADTGRFSSTNPNGQNMPQRDGKYGNLIRSIFVAKEGKKWIKADYSNQEGRLQVHDAIRYNMPSSLEWQARFFENPELDIHKITANMMFDTKSPADEESAEYKAWKKKFREPAKAIYLGKSFCMGRATTAQNLGLPTEYVTYHSKRTGKKTRLLTSGPEATKLIESFDKAFPFLTLLQKECQAFIEKYGYITTLIGRKCRRPPDYNNRSFTYKAISYRIQGSAADQICLALEAADKAGLDLLITVHDELCIQGDEEDAKKLKEIMENVVKLEIPVIAGISIGTSWGG